MTDSTGWQDRASVGRARRGCPYCHDTGVMRRAVGIDGGCLIFGEEPCAHSWSPLPQPQGSLFGAAA